MSDTKKIEQCIKPNFFFLFSPFTWITTWLVGRNQRVFNQLWSGVDEASVILAVNPEEVNESVTEDQNDDNDSNDTIPLLNE